MTINYKPDVKEWHISSNSRRFRLSIFHDKYLLEEIDWPCNDLSYINEFNSLGKALETIIYNEMEENNYDKN